MAINSKNLLVWVKAMSRGQALPLDASEVYSTYAEAEAYAASPTAYAGQTIKALTGDGKYHSYVLQPSGSGYILDEVGAIKESDLKQYVRVVNSLPNSGQVEGVLYICGTTGSIWTGTAWRTVFEDISSDVTADITAVDKRIDDLAASLTTKYAPLASPVFSGIVKIGSEEVAVKSYVDGLIANIVSSAPGIVNKNKALPTKGYKAGQTFRVAEAGTYAGQKCEAGDLIIVVANYSSGSASNADFMVVQTNVDGAVTSSADAATVGEIVVFDAATGKVIKGSGIHVASLNDTISKTHEHSNKNTLDTYNKSQSDLLSVAKSEAEALVTAHETAVSAALDDKADKATTLAGYGIDNAYTKTEMDTSLNNIVASLNTKVTGDDVDNKIKTAKEEIIEETNDVDTARIVDGNVTKSKLSTEVQVSLDKANSASADATAKSNKALENAKTYTDTSVSVLQNDIDMLKAVTYVAITADEITEMFNA